MIILTEVVKDEHQAVGYLADGTMIVVNHAVDKIGSSRVVLVISTMSYVEWAEGMVLYTIGLLLLYSLLYLLAFLWVKCKDDGWAISPFIRGALAASLALGLALMGPIAYYKYTSYALGWMGLILLTHAVLAGALYYRSRKGLLPWWGRWLLGSGSSVVLLLLFILAIGLGFVAESVWAGVSFMFFPLWLVCMVGSLQQEASYLPFWNPEDYKPLYVGQYFFPIFAYNPRLQELEDASLSALVVLGGLFALFCYGMVTVFVWTPEIIGLSIASTASTLICLFTLVKLGYSRQLLDNTAQHFVPEVLLLAYDKAKQEFDTLQEVVAEGLVPKVSCELKNELHSKRFPKPAHAAQRKDTVQELLSDRWFVMRTWPAHDKWDALMELELKIKEASPPLMLHP